MLLLFLFQIGYGIYCVNVCFSFSYNNGTYKTRATQGDCVILPIKVEE